MFFWFLFPPIRHHEYLLQCLVYFSVSVGSRLVNYLLNANFVVIAMGNAYKIKMNEKTTVEKVGLDESSIKNFLFDVLSQYKKKLRSFL